MDLQRNNMTLSRLTKVTDRQSEPVLLTCHACVCDVA